MISTIPQAFAAFELKIALTDKQVNDINARVAAATKILSDLFPTTSNMPLAKAYLIGSARRGTMIRPPEDVDLFAIFDDTQVWSTYRGKSGSLLYRVRNALNDRYNTTVVGSRGQAVRLFFTAKPHVDIVPAFPVDGRESFLIPRGGIGWIETSPFKHVDFLSQRNAELDSRLKPLIRILKRWNDVHSSRFGSFHLELVAQLVFSRLGTSRAQALARFFEWAPDYLDVTDPAGYGGNLAEYWSYTHRVSVIRSLNSSQARAEAAIAQQNAGNHAEAARLWRIILGDEFPAIS